MKNIEHIINRQINRWNNITRLLRYAPGHTEQSTAELEAEIARIHPVICVMRDLGAGARQIARDLCRRLRYELFGTALIDEIAKDLKLQRHLVDCLDEDVRGGLETMVHTYLRGHEIHPQEYLTSLVRVLQTLAMKGGVVVLGRGAPYVVGRQSALNLLIIAPLEERIARVRQYEDCDETAARRLIEEHDERRRQFVQRLFDVDRHDPRHFDLVLNTGRIPPDKALPVILSALEARGFEPDSLAIPPQAAPPESEI